MPDLEEITQYIKENMSEKVTGKTLARHFRYSEYYFNRAFKKKVGCTLKTYINKIVLEEARKQLSEGRSVSKVTENCGYQTIDGFDKAYKKMYGYTPKEEPNKNHEEK